MASIYFQLLKRALAFSIFNQMSPFQSFCDNFHTKCHGLKQTNQKKKKNTLCPHHSLLSQCCCAAYHLLILGESCAFVVEFFFSTTSAIEWYFFFCYSSASFYGGIFEQEYPGLCIDLAYLASLNP